MTERTAMRLVDAVRESRRLHEPFRRRRLELVKRFVGHNYGETRDKPTMLNLVQMAVTVFRRQIAARSPQVVCIAARDEMRATASDLELAVNHDLREMRVEKSIAECVVNALFSVGAMKVGLSPKSARLANAIGNSHDPGMAFADPVSDDDFVCDMMASRWDHSQFMGDRYEIPLYALQARGIKDVPATEPSSQNEQGDEMAVSLQRGGQYSNRRGYIDVARVWDMWLPHERKVSTFLADQNGEITSRLLWEKPWKGPERGPYHVLSFESVPGNVMPVSPIASLAALHDTINAVARKQRAQAERQKTIGVAPTGSEALAGSVKDASDGDVLLGDGQVQELRFGGADGPGMAYLLQMKELANWMGGNLDALGGLGRQANTVGQESLIARASSMKIADMQDTTTRWVQGIVEAVAFYRWTNPEPTAVLRKPVGTSGYTIPVQVGEWDGDLEDIGIEIAPYSMQSRTPAERMQSIVEIVTQMALPMAQMLQQQGKVVDAGMLFDEMARYRNMPEIGRIVRPMTEEERASQQQTSERPLQSPVTTRRNVRESVSGGNDGATAQAMADLMQTGG